MAYNPLPIFLPRTKRVPRMPSIHDVLSKIRETATSTHRQGEQFECLIRAFLLQDPLQNKRFSDVWLWQDWPGREDQPDTGIDLVAKERGTEGYCAIQCKFYAEEHRVQKADIDSFFTASGKYPFTSRLIVATTEFSSHAEAALTGQRPPVQRLRLEDLEQSLIDWGTFNLHCPDDVRLRKPHPLRPHQKEALADVMAGLAHAERGKLIMACGTGKTLTALRLAEQCLQGFTPWTGDYVAGGQVLFLVPSIALLAQSLREWTAHAKVSLRCFAVCSDTAVGKRTDESGLHLYDLPFPATTEPKTLIEQWKKTHPTPLTVVFATYHSIQVIAEAQAQGFPAFDLIICDEAHRTTGVTLTGKDESHFVKVHDGELIRARRRLYMTATPRLFTDAAKTQAKEHDALLCSMDDEALYGKELHRLGFGKAVSQGLLSDYKVMVLAVDEGFVSQTFQQQLAEGGELNLDDAVKITGCWNGLSKRMVRDAQGGSLPGDSAPMRRAVAFARTIKDSQRIAQLFAEVVDQYTEESQAAGREETFLDCEVRHVDGTMNMLKRGKELQWLKDDPGASSCRILSNARCLAEGVDVPALDAVLFLNPPPLPRGRGAIGRASDAHLPGKSVRVHHFTHRHSSGGISGRGAER